MKLTAIVPVLNEEIFLPLYLKCVTSFADEILIADGGSTDNSLACIRRFQNDYNIRVFSMKQTGLPYTEDWNEPFVRNFLLEQATGDWIMNLDVDEVVDDQLLSILPGLMDDQDVNVYQFPFVNFWRDTQTVRVNVPGDEHWSHDIIRMWRNHIGIRYNDEKHHCKLHVNGESIWVQQRQRVNVPIYHYHYALGPRIKFNDNRRFDVNRYYNTEEPDWTFHHGMYEIRTQPFTGKHPALIEAYLSGQSLEPGS